ncbi:glycosyltransferase [Arcticibacter sp. MXS-1]|uniref:glycosyltransferase n=1 Tax=Arcticibacter sp. MXS-1 TaxID=3341726 RepID=UPI0035A8F874
MRIAMILPSLSATGPGIMVRELTGGLQRHGHLCKVFYFDEIPEIEMPCPVERIGFFDAIDLKNWDVVHSHMLRPDSYIAFRKAVERDLRRVRFVSTLHNPVSYRAFRTGYGRPASVLGVLAWKAALAAFHSVVVLNLSIYETISGVSRKKLDIVYNGRDISPAPCSLLLSKDSVLRALIEKYCIMGTVSSLTKRKGLDQMIKALPQLPEFAAVIVGSGPEERSLKSLAEELGVQERCFFAGQQADPLPWHSLFDVFVMCSSSEGFPLALIEAAANKTPSVLSDIPVFKSIVSDKEAVFYQLGHIDSLAAAIRRAHDHSSAYSDAIGRYYTENLTADKMVNAYLRVYRGEGASA